MANFVDPKEIYDYLLSQGLSIPAAQGILANVKHESRFNSTAVGDNGMSYGLFQHYDTRRDALLRYANRQGKHQSDWKTQVDFALTEARIRGADLRAEDAVEFSEWWTTKWEIPADKERKAKIRSRDVGEFNYAVSDQTATRRAQMLPEDNQRITLSEAALRAEAAANRVAREGMVE